MAITLQGTSTRYENGSTTNVNLPYPTGIVAGELLLAHIGTSDATAPVSAPTGWTLNRAQDGVLYISCSTYYRIATGSETGSVTFTTNTVTDAVTGIMERWSGVNTTTPFDATAVGANADNLTTLTMPGITTATANAVLVHTIVLDSIDSTGDAINTLAGTTRLNATTSTGRVTGVYYETRPTAGATGTRTWTKATGQGSVEWAGITTALKPAAVAYTGTRALTGSATLTLAGSVLPSSFINTAEGGINGTAVTTGNTGGTSGDAVAVVDQGAGNSFTFSTDAAMTGRGSLGYKLDYGTQAPGTLAWGVSVPGRLAMRFYVYIPSSDALAHAVSRTALTSLALSGVVTSGGSSSNYSGTIARTADGTKTISGVATQTPPSIPANPARLPAPNSTDHREFMHGMNIVQYNGQYMVLFSSNNYPPTQPSGDWVDDVYYSYFTPSNAAATFSVHTLVSRPTAQEPTSAAVNSDGHLMVTTEDAEYSANFDQTYGVWDSNNLGTVLASYGQLLMPPQGGHSGHVAASGNMFMVSFSDGWVDGGGVDNNGTGDDVFGKLVDTNGNSGPMINTAVGTGNRDWWPIIAGSDTNFLQVWMRYGGVAGDGGGTLLGAIINFSGTTGTKGATFTIFSNNLYYYHDVQWVPALNLYLVVGSQFVSSNKGIAVLINKSGTIVATTTGLPNTVREAQTAINGQTAAYPADGIGVAVLDLTATSITLRKTVTLDWLWDYMGTSGVFVTPTWVVFATGSQDGVKFLHANLA